MPARDKCEPQVIRALQKAGWNVVKHQVRIGIGQVKKAKVGASVYADLLLERNQQKILMIEVKCFLYERSYLDELYHAMGQYLIYQEGVEMRGLDEKLYLAIPFEVYLELTKQEGIRRAIKRAKIGLVLFDLAAEEIVEWIPTL